jgi:hypothetical protein
MNGSGQKVLGFYSKIDDSPQPYGVEDSRRAGVQGGEEAGAHVDLAAWPW